MRKLICKKEITGSKIMNMISEYMIKNNKNLASYAGKIYVEVETILNEKSNGTRSFKDWTIIVEVFGEESS